MIMLAGCFMLTPSYKQLILGPERPLNICFLLFLGKTNGNKCSWIISMGDFWPHSLHRSNSTLCTRRDCWGKLELIYHLGTFNLTW